MKEKRQKRLNSEFQKQIYELLVNKVKNKDPRLTEMFTVTGVDVTNDLEQAKVYISVFSGSAEAKKQTFAAIKDSAGFIRKEISKNMHIRTVPEFIFLEDRQAEYGDKIDRILSTITYTTEPDGAEGEDENA